MKARSIAGFFYYLIKGLILLGLFRELFYKNLENAFWIALVFGATFIPSWLKQKYRLYLPIEFDLAILLTLFLHALLGEVYGYYYKFWWWDMFLHAQSGLLLGILGFALVYLLSKQKNIGVKMPAGLVSFFAFCFAVTTGALWEVFEFFMDNVFAFNMQKSGLPDTMSDLIVNGLAALLVSLIGYLWMKKRISFFVFDHSVSRFVQRKQSLLGTD